jgi:molybdopterin/thiamine biosynthesis adenylyltransferase
VDHTRHLDLFDAHNLDVTLIGAGGIWAITALVLGKMGVGSIQLADNDQVDEVNLATQFHRHSDVGRPKVCAVEDLLQEFAADTFVGTTYARVTRDAQMNCAIVISAVDSIQARKDIWEAVKNGHVLYYLDARMAAEEFHLYTVSMKGDITWYDEMLAAESDETALQEACTRKATIYTAAFSAGHIGNTLKQIAVRDLPPRRVIHNIRTNFLTALP